MCCKLAAESLREGHLRQAFLFKMRKGRRRVSGAVSVLTKDGGRAGPPYFTLWGKKGETDGRFYKIGETDGLTGRAGKAIICLLPKTERGLGAPRRRPEKGGDGQNKRIRKGQESSV